MPNPLPITPSPARDLQTSLYTQWGSTDAWDVDPGVMFLPIAATEEEAADPDFIPIVVVQIHAPVRTKTTSFAAEKARSAPVIPKPTDSGPFTFLGGKLSIPHPTYDSTLNGVTWSVEGAYLFVQNARSDIDLGDGFIQTTPPWKTTMQSSLLQFGLGALGGLATAATGALASAGASAQVGAAVGESIQAAITSRYEYNEPAYYPVSLMSDSLIKGGASTV